MGKYFQVIKQKRKLYLSMARQQQKSPRNSAIPDAAARKVSVKRHD